MPFEVFNGGAVQNAYVSYQLYSDTADPNPFVGNDLVLIWPNSYQTGNTTAAFMDIEVSDAGRNVILPDARQVSPGTNFIINNKSTEETFNLLDSTLNLIITNFPVSTSYYIILTDNTTEGGTWEKVLFGANTPDFSTVTPGYGLTGPLTGQSANTLNTIDTYKNATATIGSTYQMTLDDMGKCLVVNITASNIQQIWLPLLSTIPAGFYVILRNQSGGNVGVNETAADPNHMQINGGNFVLQQGNAITLFYSGVISGGNYQFYTYGSTSLSLPVSLANGGTGINATSTSQLFNYLAPNNSAAAGSINYSNGTATIGGTLCNTYTNLAPPTVPSVLMYNTVTNAPYWNPSGDTLIAYVHVEQTTGELIDYASGNWITIFHTTSIPITDVDAKSILSATINLTVSSKTFIRWVKYNPANPATVVPFSISTGGTGTACTAILNYPFTDLGNMQTITLSGIDASPTDFPSTSYALQVNSANENACFFNIETNTAGTAITQVGVSSITLYVIG